MTLRLHPGFTLLWLLSTVLMLSCAGVKPQPATPQRPSFSSDPNTAAPGTFEMEAGPVFDGDGYWDTPLAVKWGAGERTELFASNSPYVRIGGASGTNGWGDLRLGTRHRFLDEQEYVPAAAIQLATKLPTADAAAGLGTGEVDAFLALTALKGVGRTTLVAYYQLGVLGDPSGPGTLTEHGVSGLVGYPLGPRLSGFLEFTGVFHPGIRDEAILTTLGVGYAVAPSVVCDAAVVWSESGGGSSTVWTAGVTANVGGFKQR